MTSSNALREKARKIVKPYIDPEEAPSLIDDIASALLAAKESRRGG